MGRLVRSTTGCECTLREVGRVIYCHTVVFNRVGAWWALREPEKCPHCGQLREGYLDADLDPIRPPPLTKRADESQPLEVQGA